MLAYYHYPFVQNQNYREYIKDDLMKLEVVEELFDYCQILEAYITKKGWEFLIDYYGYEKLYEIDKKVVGLMMKRLKNILHQFILK